MLLARPMNTTNKYPLGVRYDSALDAATYNNEQVQFVLPLASNDSSRYPRRMLRTSNPPFNMSQFPAVVSAVTADNYENNNAYAAIKTENEAGEAVSARYALVDNSFVD